MTAIYRVRGYYHKINMKSNRFLQNYAIKGRLPSKTSAVQSKFYCISLQFFGHIIYHDGRGGGISATQNKCLIGPGYENQDKEVVYSQNSDVDEVNLESDCPPSSSSSSSDSDGGNMSGPEHVELVSLTIPPKVFRSASNRFTSLSFAERCYPYHELSALTRVRQGLSILQNPQMGQTKLQEKDRILQMG